jgi:K+-transporting ATPase ATPase C chain
MIVSMKTLIISMKILLFFTVLTGIIYPLAITGIAQLLFPGKSNGSLVYKNNIPVGSSLIGQKFDTAIYFSSRPSAIGYNPLPSGGSNLSMTSSKLKIIASERITRFLKVNRLDSTALIPSEMIFASASGLDPHISYQAALLQLDRVAISRNFTEKQKQILHGLINRHLEPPEFNLFGESRVNVLLLNLDVDSIK